jgi:hypothetical protein
MVVRERKGGRRIWGENKNSLVDLYHKEMEARDPCTDFGMRDRLDIRRDWNDGERTPHVLLHLNDRLPTNTRH